MAIDLSFREFLNLAEGPVDPSAAAPGKPQQDLVYKALGIRPKDLKHGLFSGAQLGTDDEHSSGVRTFSVDDVDATKGGEIKSMDIKMLPTGKMGPTGIEDMVKKGDKWFAKLTKDMHSKKKTAGRKWFNDVQAQSQAPPAGAGAMSMTPGMM